jgi:predicted nuclease of predicted toxin-antitoxin system
VTRLLLDQGLPRSAVELLRAEGWDVVHAVDCGLATASDEQILEFARSNDRTVCTLDADFHALLAVSGARAPSVVRIRRQGLRGPEIASLLKRVWTEVRESIERGAVISVTDRAVRVRRLPVLGDSGSTRSHR